MLEYVPPCPRCGARAYVLLWGRPKCFACGYTPCSLPTRRVFSAYVRPLDTTESLNRFIDRLDRHWQREVRRRSEREQKTAVALLNRQQRVVEARIERDRRAAESRIERARARAAGKVARYEVAAAELLPVARRFKYDVARLATHFGLSFNGMRKRMVTLGVPTRSFEAWNDSKTAVTRRRVNRELARNGGNGAQAARALGMGKATIRKYRNTPATPGRPPLTAAV